MTDNVAGESNMPEGYVEITGCRIYTNGKDLVITGEAPDETEDPECEIHDCDFMGCNWEHVLIRAKPLNKWHAKWMKWFHKKNKPVKQKEPEIEIIY